MQRPLGTTGSRLEVRPGSGADLLARARAVLDTGPDGVAGIDGDTVPVRAITASDGRLLAVVGTDRLASLPLDDDVAGDLRLSGRAGGIDRVVQSQPVQVWVAGWWRRVSTVEVLAGARDLLGRVPVTALIDPAGWLASATVLALEPAEAIVTLGQRQTQLDDRRLSRWLDAGE